MPNVLWGSSEHHYLLGWAVLSIVLWCGGALVALGIFTVAGERRLPRILRGAGGKFLKAHYRPGFESFELMYMLRRITLTLTAILVVNETAELVIINGLLFIFGLVHFWMRPFRDPVHNYIEAVSVVLLFLLYDVETALVTLDMDGGAISSMLDVVEVAGVLIFIPFLLRDVRIYFRRKIAPKLRRCWRGFRKCCGSGGGGGSGGDGGGVYETDVYGFDNGGGEYKELGDSDDDNDMEGGGEGLDEPPRVLRARRSGGGVCRFFCCFGGRGDTAANRPDPGSLHEDLLGDVNLSNRNLRLDTPREAKEEYDSHEAAESFNQDTECGGAVTTGAEERCDVCGDSQCAGCSEAEGARTAQARLPRQQGVAASKTKKGFLLMLCAAMIRGTGATVNTVLEAMAVNTAVAAKTHDMFAQERVALEALYNATGGEHWSDSPKNGWLGPCHCQWAGVFCVDSNACDDSPVLNLVRETVNLVGMLPSWDGDPSHGALPMIQGLDISSNPGLGGVLPVTWGSMTELTQLLAYSNSLSGILPEEYSAMAHLYSLQLNSNQLSGTLPVSFSQMSQISELFLRENRFSGTVPAEYGNMVRLTPLNRVVVFPTRKQL